MCVCVCVCVCVLGLWWIPSKPLCIWKQQELKNWKGRWPVICGVPGILDLVKMPYETEWCNWLPINDHFFIEPPTPKTPPPFSSHEKPMMSCSTYGTWKHISPGTWLAPTLILFLTPSSPKAPTVMLVFMHVSWIRLQKWLVKTLPKKLINQT